MGPVGIDQMNSVLNPRELKISNHTFEMVDDTKLFAAQESQHKGGSYNGEHNNSSGVNESPFTPLPQSAKQSIMHLVDYGLIDINTYKRKHWEEGFELGEKRFYHEFIGKDGQIIFILYNRANQLMLHYHCKKVIRTRKNQQRNLQLNLAKVEMEIDGNYIRAYHVEKGGRRQKIVFAKKDNNGKLFSKYDIDEEQ